jgi:hypothetical protein
MTGNIKPPDLPLDPSGKGDHAGIIARVRWLSAAKSHALLSR